jgi:hypothetical protein
MAVAASFQVNIEVALLSAIVEAAIRMRLRLEAGTT